MKKKIYLLCSIIVLLSFFSTNFVFASENENFSQENANVFIENLLLENKDFSTFNNFKITENLNLTNVEYKLPRITLYRFKTDSDNGYLIELNGEVIEFAPTN